MRRAFSLIELLVVVALISLLASIAIPSILRSQHSAQITVGHANLRSMSQLHTAFAIERKGEFYNPFTGQDGSPSDLAAVGSYHFGWAVRTRYTSEAFAAYWHAYWSARKPRDGFAPESAFSPADGDAIRQFRSAGGGRGDALVPGSFYYSPTFWRAPEGYNFVRIARSCASNENGPQYRPDPRDQRCRLVEQVAISRNGLETVAFPSQKVMLFERADFSQRTRSEVRQGDAGRANRHPAWNNPAARPGVVAVDGSVTRADVRELTRLAAEAPTNDPSLAALPVDLLEAPDLLPPLPSGGTMAIEGHAETDGLYPMFFAATRYGLRGRDLCR